MGTRNWLRRMRKDRDLTQQEISKKLGISQQYYCLIESGKRQGNIDLKILSGLALVFCCSINEILDLEFQYKQQSSPETSRAAG